MIFGFIMSLKCYGKIPIWSFLTADFKNEDNMTLGSNVHEINLRNVT
jgi:hypothetical protein